MVLSIFSHNQNKQQSDLEALTKEESNNIEYAIAGFKYALENYGDADKELFKEVVKIFTESAKDLAKKIKKELGNTDRSKIEREMEQFKKSLTHESDLEEISRIENEMAMALGKLEAFDFIGEN